MVLTEVDLYCNRKGIFQAVALLMIPFGTKCLTNLLS